MLDRHGACSSDSPFAFSKVRRCRAGRESKKIVYEFIEVTGSTASRGIRALQSRSGMLLAPGLVPGIPAYSVKVHAEFSGGGPAIAGVLILHDLATGAPLAILESLETGELCLSSSAN